MGVSSTVSEKASKWVGGKDANMFPTKTSAEMGLEEGKPVEDGAEMGLKVVGRVVSIELVGVAFGVVPVSRVLVCCRWMCSRRTPLRTLLHTHSNPSPHNT